MPPSPTPPPPSVRVRRYPIPDRLAPYIETAESLNLINAVGLRWNLLPTNCVSFNMVVGDPERDFEFDASTFEALFRGLLPRAFGTWSDAPFTTIGVTMTPRAMMYLPMQGIDAAFSLAPGPISLQLAMASAAGELEARACDLARLWRVATGAN